MQHTTNNGRNKAATIVMFNLGGEKILFILLVATVLLAPNDLPNIMRRAGGFHRDYRRITNQVRNELSDALSPTAARPEPATLATTTGDLDAAQAPNPAPLEHTDTTPATVGEHVQINPAKGQ